MGVKPIIDIEVNDGAFKRFYDLYREYAAEVEGMPDKWRAIGEVMGEGTQGLQDGAVTAREALALAAAQAGVIAEALREATKAQSGLGSETSKSGKAMEGLAKGARGVAGAISTLGSWIIKIGALGGLGALFSGFGIGELASSAFTRVRASGQLGISPGALASFQVNAQQFLTTQALEAAANAQIDNSKTGYLATLGIYNAQAMSAGDLAFEELKAARQAYIDAQKRGLPPMQMPELQSYLALGGNIGDVRNAASQPLSELLAAQNRTRAGAGPLGFDRATGQEWIRLKRTLDEAGVSIQTSLIKGLAPLAPQITTLAKDLGSFITQVLSSKSFSDFIHVASDELQKLGDFLTTLDWKKIGQDVDTFGHDVAGVVNFLGDKLGWILGTHEDNGPKVPGTNETPYQMFWGNDDWFDKATSAFGKDFQKGIQDRVKGFQDFWKGQTTPIVAPANAAGIGPYSSAVAYDMSHNFSDKTHTGSDPFLRWSLAHTGDKLGLYDVTSAHGPGSRHYLGQAADIDTINGRLVGTNLKADEAWVAKTLRGNPAIRLGVNKDIYAWLQQQHQFNQKQYFLDPGDYGHIHMETRPDVVAKMLKALPKHTAAVLPKAPTHRLAQPLPNQIRIVDQDIAKYGKDWMKHLPRDVAEIVAEAHLTKKQQTSTDVSEINKTLKAVLARRAQKPVHVSVSNSTASRIAVSANAAAVN